MLREPTTGSPFAPERPKRATDFRIRETLLVEGAGLIHGCNLGALMRHRADRGGRGFWEMLVRLMGWERAGRRAIGLEPTRAHGRPS
jgi:hypothetical protein